MGSRPGAPHFDGKCNFCWGDGHRKADCVAFDKFMAERRRQGLSGPRGQKGGGKGSYEAGKGFGAAPGGKGAFGLDYSFLDQAGGWQESNGSANAIPPSGNGGWSGRICAPLLRVDPAVSSEVEPRRNLPPVGELEMDFTIPNRFEKLREIEDEVEVPTEHDSRSPGGTLSSPPPDVATPVPSEAVAAANLSRRSERERRRGRSPTPRFLVRPSKSALTCEHGCACSGFAGFTGLSSGALAFPEVGREGSRATEIDIEAPIAAGAKEAVPKPGAAGAKFLNEEATPNAVETGDNHAMGDGGRAAIGADDRRAGGAGGLHSNTYVGISFSTFVITHTHTRASVRE